MVTFIQISTVFTTLLVLTTAHPFFPCDCGIGPGEEICKGPKKCAPLVVRPVELPKPQSCTNTPVCAPLPNLPNLVPVGGPCSCQQAIVTPAVVPRPACTACCPKKRISKCDCELNEKLTLEQQQRLLFGGAVKEEIIFTGPSNRPIFAEDVILAEGNPALLSPADAVSVAIAYNAANKKCPQGEGDLSFGFKTLPKEVKPCTKTFYNIPEEKLYKINGQPVELKIKQLSCGKSVDEEAAEDLLLTAAEEAEEAAAERAVKRLTLGEIGYGPSKPAAAPLVDVPATPTLDLGKEQCLPGFVPGNVVIQEKPDVEPIVDFPAPYPEPCREPRKPSANVGFPSVPLGYGWGRREGSVSSSFSSSCNCQRDFAHKAQVSWV